MDASYGMQQQQGRKQRSAVGAPPSEAFIFESPEGQAPTSILATGHLNEQARMDPSISAGLSMANNFTGPSSLSKGATMQESFVQAVITSDQLGLLTTRLAGLSSERSIFTDLEEVFTVPVLNAASNPIASATGTVPNVSIRVRRSMLPQSKENGVLPVLRYLGSVEAEKTVLRRSCLEIPVNGDLIRFLDSLGFKKDFEYVAEGEVFVRGRAKVLVYSVNARVANSRANIANGGPPAQLQNLCQGRSLMVEVSAVGSPADDTLQKEVAEFVELLYPLIVPGRVDHARLMCL